VKSAKEIKLLPGDLVDIITDNAYNGTGLVIGYHEEHDAWARPLFCAYKVLTTEGRLGHYFAAELWLLE